MSNMKLALSMLVVAVMLSSLGLAVALASYQDQVTEVRVEATPATASSKATYKISFVTTGDVTAGGAVTVSFPDEVSLPSTISKSLISLRPGNSDSGFVEYGEDTDPDPIVSGQDIIVTIPSGDTLLAGDCALVISQGAGITNPVIARTKASERYEVKVVTSVDNTAGSGNPGYLGVVPSYKVKPDEAARFSTVVVTGKGWAPNADIDIGGAVSGSGTTQQTGVFSVICSPVEDGIVTVEDGSGQTADDPKWDYPVELVEFALEPRIEINPTSGGVGTRLMIAGYDFTTSGDLVEITIAGEDVWSLPTTLETRDAWGSDDDFSVEVEVPLGISGGRKPVKATDSAGRTAEATFSVDRAALTVSPTSGPPGTSVTVSGTNFGAEVGGTGADVVTFGGQDTDPPQYDIETDEAGGFSVTFDVPMYAKPGYNEVKAFIAGIEVEVSFFVSDGLLVLDPTSGDPGIAVWVSGANMTPDATILSGDLSFGGIPWNAEPIQIDSTGGVARTKLAIPLTASMGENSVLARDDHGMTAAATFTVIVSAANQLASISDQLVIVWGYYEGEWRMYDPKDPASDLDTLIEDRGYWVEVSEPCTLAYGGKSWSLVAGWNNIGW